MVKVGLNVMEFVGAAMVCVLLKYWANDQKHCWNACVCVYMCLYYNCWLWPGGTYL